MINLVRLSLLFLGSLILYPLFKERAIFYFLNFAGPSFIKLGQALSVRPDLAGKKLAKTLAQFQDKVAAFDDKLLRKILKEEYGENFDKIFSEFDFKAVASASIAQVHKAKTIDGKIVAVKVLRPQIAKIMVRDIRTLKIIIKIISLFSKFLAKSLSDIALLLQNLQKSELDLLHEASNASRLKEELKDVKGFYVPEIFWKISTSKILVLEWTVAATLLRRMRSRSEVLP